MSKAASLPGGLGSTGQGLGQSAAAEAHDREQTASQVAIELPAAALQEHTAAGSQTADQSSLDDQHSASAMAQEPAHAQQQHQHHHSHSGTDAEDKVCVICFEKPSEYVLMPCGHSGYCQVCAHRVFVKPPHHCPICRQLMHGVLRVPIDTAVGESVLISAA